MSGEVVIPLASEEVEVATKHVSESVTRIRRFTASTPEGEAVESVDKRLRAIRTAILHPESIRGPGWADETIELHEMIKRPALANSAQEAEEVAVRTQRSEHVKTVRETVRRQQIVVERITGG